MIHISRVDLTDKGIVLPHDRVGMVVAQPYLPLTTDEPFRCIPENKAQLLADLSATLTVAALRPHGVEKTHFTIFPEYSIPGPEGIELIDGVLADQTWPCGTIVIGGVDALSKAEFEALANQPGSHLDIEHNGVEKIQANEWVNCAITWIKAEGGVVERWLQPKLWPAWEENAITYQNMFRGKSVFAFKGSLANGVKYHFSSLICFDWIKSIDEKRAWRWVLDDLDAQAADAQLPLSWMFVIQRNPRPSHQTFLGEVASFFNNTVVPNVRRDRTCLVFANCAGKPKPGRSDEYGGCSLVFTKQTLFKEESSRPTVAKGSQRFRLSPLLHDYRDTFFREHGACVHSFAQINPDSIAAGPANRTFAVDRPFVFPFAASTDPRTPSNLVPACVKWVNDELDSVPSLSTLQPGSPLEADADAAHNTVVTALRALSAHSTAKAIKLATVRDSNAAGVTDDADAWDKPECDALHHVVHTLDIFGICAPTPATDQDIAHATITIGGRTLDLLTVRGRTHEQCLKHAEHHFTPAARRQALLVTRDHDNLPLKRRSRSILQTEAPRLGAERRYTDPASGMIHIDYQSLISTFHDAATVAELAEGINARVAA